MSLTTQVFKFGLNVKKLDLISLETERESKFIYVDDVLQVFRISGTVEFESDGVSIACMRDDNGVTVIKIVHETALPDSTSLTSTIAHGYLNEPIDLLSINSEASGYKDPPEPVYPGTLRRSTIQFREDLKISTESLIAKKRAATTLDAHFIVDESLSAECHTNVATHRNTNPEFESRVMKEPKEIRRDVMEELKDIQKGAEESLELKKQMNDRLVLIQSKTEAIFTQNYELHEFTIPRLFIILPETLTSWDPTTMFKTKFRLHFICECGTHTKPTKDIKMPASEIPHELHLAKHEGYIVNKPTELFRNYGPFLMVMLEIIKHGPVLVGSVAPSVSAVNSVTSKGIDYSLKFLEEIRASIKKSDGVNIDSDDSAWQQDLARYLSSVRGLEGADLRQLGSYLTSSDNLLGNLYRMTTQDGHVKWVCNDHYRASYQEEHIQVLRDVVKLARGEFNEQLGRITITLTSSIAATKFYKAVSKGDGILELILDLRWECNRRDLEPLEDALKASRYQGIELRKLLEQLKTKSNATTLDLKGGLIGSIGALVLSEALKTNSILTTLDLGCNSIGDDGARVLSEALQSNPTLTTLDLGWNSIGKNGAQALSEALKTSSIVTTLNLESNSIGDDGAQALSEALKTNSILITLDLERNSIGDDGALVLSEALKTNSSLTTLKLDSNSIGDDGARVLSEALTINSILTTLDLGGNSIGDNGALVLSEALKTNSSLTSLKLDSSLIGNNGAQVLSEALKTNSTLTNLDLSWNSIGTNGAQALSEALKTNSTLTTLDLVSNSIEFDGAQALSEAVRTNPTLTTLNLQENPIKFNGAQALHETLKTNWTLSLRLKHYSSGDNGAQALSEALKTNS
ncbi:hypothetical protein BGZ98_007517 [Dissophora globulifera]|nr:hypothetical protein BGZ98_007517 [Dissophora globulifera]